MISFKPFRITAACTLALAGLAAQADTQNLSVTATVQSMCKFTSTAQTMNFNIDPSSASTTIAGTMSSNVTYRCSKGVTPGTVTADNGGNFSGTRRMKDGATTNFLPYTLTVAGGGAGTGFGSAEDKTLSITGSVAQADFQNATASSGYADAVVLTVAP